MTREIFHFQAVPSRLADIISGTNDPTHVSLAPCEDHADTSFQGSRPISLEKTLVQDMR